MNISETKTSYGWNRLASIATLLLGTFLLSIDRKVIQNYLSYGRNASVSDVSDESNTTNNEPFAGIGTTEVTLSHTAGDPTTCVDIIYTGHTQDPFDVTMEERGSDMVNRGWEGMAYLVRMSPALKRNTCLVFFTIHSPLKHESGNEMHPVWGRLPATALVMTAFPKAEIFLYMDSDALLSFPDKTPTMMYNELAYDGYGDDATFQHLKPGLIVNKPHTGWLCGQCEIFGLGHGCFNSGALLWNRENAEPVLRAWWASRNLRDNFKHPEDGEDGFHGWNGDHARKLNEKMGEQNRLMFLFATDPIVRARIWPVPREKNPDNGSESCPSRVSLPCLQNDFLSRLNWRPSDPSCFISHYSDEKQVITEHADAMINDKFL